MQIENLMVKRVVRYGLPIVILVFYLTAAMQIEYTPDSTFIPLHLVQTLPHIGLPSGESPSPFWIFFLNVGSLFGLDPVLVAKVLSLFFSCLAILCSYLLAYEIIVDRLLAFCLSLAVAMQAWMLQLAPSGNAMPLGLLLSVGFLFFLLRNEYTVAAFVAGLACMVFWQAVLFLPLLVLDIQINSVDKRKGSKRSLLSLIIAIAAILPWFMYVVWQGLPVTTMIVPLGEFPAIAWETMIVLAVCAVLMLVGIISMARAVPDGRRFLLNQTAPFIWLAWMLVTAVVAHREFWVMVTPLLFIYSFVGLRYIARTPKRIHSLVLLLTAVLLGLNQGTLHMRVRDIMHNSIQHNRELRSIAYWLSFNADADATVAAERKGTLEYYTGRNIIDLQNGIQPKYAVTRNPEVAGYSLAYNPVADLQSPDSLITHFTLWKRE